MELQKVYNWISANIDKICHALVSLVIVLFITLLLHKIGFGIIFSRVISIIIAYIIGIGKELIDHSKMKEDFDKNDVKADIIGIMIGFLITFLI